MTPTDTKVQDRDFTTTMRPSVDPSAAAFPATAHLSAKRVGSSFANPEAAQLEAYFQDIEVFPQLSANAERELALSARQGEKQAWRQLIEHNLRLVIRIASRYRGHGVPFTDLVQEGNLGLLHAAGNYDPAIGRFSTYAYWWINQYIVRALHKQGTLIRLPSHVHEQELIPLKQARSHLLQKEEGEPDAEALAQETGMTVERIGELLRAATPTISFDQPSSVSTDIPIGDVLTDEEAESVEEQALKPIVAREIRELLQSLLPPRYYTVLQLRYGLDDMPVETLAAIGKQLGVSYQRVRQIEAAALEMLQCSPQLIQFQQALTQGS